MDEEIETILKNVPHLSTLDWNGNLNKPLVYRSTTPNQSTAWIETLKRITGVQEIEADKYTRLNVQESDETIAISIFKNNTVMFQGDQSYKWASKNMHQICKEIKSHENEIPERRRFHSSYY